MRGLFLLAAYVALAYFSISALIDVESFGEFIIYIIVSAICIPIIHIVIGFVFMILFGEDK